MDLKLTRRQFALSAVASGFALAVQPVAASAIYTPPDDLITKSVSVPVGDGHIPAYMAKPEGEGPFPIILVVHEIFDLHEYIQDICRRFAKQGYLAIAPSLYAREGDATKIADPQKIITDIAAKTPDAQVMSDLDATAAFAAQNGGDANRLGVTGFCWGGRIAWLYAAHNPNLKAAVAWYGMVGKNPFNNPSARDSVATLHAPVLGLYGGKDPSIPVSTLTDMRNAMKANGKPGEIVIYPEAGHGFFADYRPSYDPQAAAAAWPRCLAWFKQYLSP